MIQQAFLVPISSPVWPVIVAHIYLVTCVFIIAALVTCGAIAKLTVGIVGCSVARTCRHDSQRETILVISMI